MRPESNFWSRWKRRITKGDVKGLWERVEAKMPIGLPDCHVLLDGRVLFVELKAVDTEVRLKHELRAEQAVWIDRWNDAGGSAYVLAYIKELNAARWYTHGKLMRGGVFIRCATPPGVYARGFNGQFDR